MRKALCILGCVVALAVAGCGDDDAAGNQTRFVDQRQAPDNPIIPIRNADEAVQTEAIGHMNLIYQRVKFSAATSGDAAGLYRSISGKLDGAKLAKIGLSEADLQGSYYKASDYTVVIVGKEMTISAAQIGTRGRVEPQKFTVP